MARGYRLSGHRGARGLWPENTLAGFAGALTLGVDALELDVVLAADGGLAVVHDPRLDPDITRDAAGRWLAPPGPRVADLTTPQLSAFDVGRARPGGATARDHPRQRPVDGAQIPMLPDVLALSAGAAVTLDLELKLDPEAEPSASERLADAVAVAIARAGAAGRCVPRCFDHTVLARWRRHRPTGSLGFLTEAADAATLAAVLDAARPGDTWAPGYETLAADEITAAHRAGLRVEPWTVNDPATMVRLLALGVDGLCTDDPDHAPATRG